MYQIHIYIKFSETRIIFFSNLFWITHRIWDNNNNLNLHSYKYKHTTTFYSSKRMNKKISFYFCNRFHTARNRIKVKKMKNITKPTKIFTSNLNVICLMVSCLSWIFYYVILFCTLYNNKKHLIFIFFFVRLPFCIKHWFNIITNTEFDVCMEWKHHVSQLFLYLSIMFIHWYALFFSFAFPFNNDVIYLWKCLLLSMRIYRMIIISKQTEAELIKISIFKWIF